MSWWEDKRWEVAMKKCPYCRKEIQDEAIKCRYCESFMKGKEPVYKISNISPATQNKRFLNLLLDTGLCFAFAFIVMFLLALSGLYGLLQIDKMNNSAFGYLMYFSYFIITETIWGKTGAKFITKTKVVLKNGSKPKPRDIFIRTLCRIIPFEALSFLGSQNPVGWHDRLSNTVVVDDI